MRSRRNGASTHASSVSAPDAVTQGGNRFAPRERLARPHDAEDVRRPGLHVIERERAEVADVDDLQRVILRSGGEHPAARRAHAGPST